MPTLFEKHNTGDNTDSWLYGATWAGQTFTPTISHKITSVKLKLYRVTTPGIVTVSIRATDGSGLPTGSDLISGTTDGDTLTTNTAGEWREVTLGAGYDLVAGTKYAIVIRSVTQTLAWRLEDPLGNYAGGNSLDSSDSGVSWTNLNDDFMFEEWGDPIISAGIGRRIRGSAERRSLISPYM